MFGVDQQARAEIAQLKAQIEALRAMYGVPPANVAWESNGVPVITVDLPDEFDAQVLSYTPDPDDPSNTFLGVYSFIQQSFDNSGQLIPAVPGMFGGTSLNPLYEMNGLVAGTDSFPFYAHIRYRISGSSGRVYEFNLLDVGSSSPITAYQNVEFFGSSSPDSLIITGVGTDSTDLLSIGALVYGDDIQEGTVIIDIGSDKCVLLTNPI